MLVHILGWLTVASEIGLAGWAAHYLFHAQEPIRQGVPVPEFIGDVSLPNNDWVGFV